MERDARTSAGLAGSAGPSCASAPGIDRIGVSACRSANTANVSGSDGGPARLGAGRSRSDVVTSSALASRCNVTIRAEVRSFCSNLRITATDTPDCSANSSWVSARRVRSSASLSPIVAMCPSQS